MKVTQIKDIINSVTGEVLGKTDLVAEDLSNLVDIGNEIVDTSNVTLLLKNLALTLGW